MHKISPRHCLVILSCMIRQLYSTRRNAGSIPCLLYYQDVLFISHFSQRMESFEYGGFTKTQAKRMVAIVWKLEASFLYKCCGLL